MDLPKRGLVSKRRCGKDLYTAQNSLKRAIRLNEALQEYLFRLEQESEILMIKRKNYTSKLVNVSVSSIRDKLSNFLRVGSVASIKQKLSVQ